MAAPSRDEADRLMDFWLDACDRLNLPEFRSCRKMLANWHTYILNAFDIHLSKGFTEGCNNAIKTLKAFDFKVSPLLGQGFCSLQSSTPTFEKEPI